MGEVEKPSGEGSDDLITRHPEEPRHPLRLQSGVGLCIVALLAAGVIVSGLNFREGRERAARSATAGADVSDGVLIGADVQSVNPTKSEMSIRVTPVPFGSYGNTSFAKPVTIQVASSHGLTTDIKDGSPISSFDLTIPLEESEVTDYPFDSYKSHLAVKIAAPDGAGNRALPTQFLVGAVQHGYKIGISPKLTQTSDDTGEWVRATATFEVRRSTATRFFAVFLMVLMWAISIGILWITLSVLFRRRRMEIPLLNFFGVVLFALPTLRNVQPDAPPFGSLTDALSFLWCESIVAACLIALIIVFVRRGPGAPPVPVRAQPGAPGS